MSNLSLWRVTTGLNLDNSFIELPVSHYWKPTTLSVSLLEGVKIVDGVSEGEYNGELEINMTSLTQNNTYSVALEWYQKDQWLFNHSQFSADGTGSEIHNVTVPKHTHEQNKTLEFPAFCCLIASSFLIGSASALEIIASGHT